MKTLVSAELRG